MQKEYKLTIEIDDEVFMDIDTPHYSGPYHDWLKSKIIMALHGIHGFPSSIRIEELKPHQQAAIQFADAIIEGSGSE
jgi:hypothetical protein